MIEFNLHVLEGKIKLAKSLPSRWEVSVPRLLFLQTKIKQCMWKNKFVHAAYFKNSKKRRGTDEISTLGNKDEPRFTMLKVHRTAFSGNFSIGCLLETIPFRKTRRVLSCRPITWISKEEESCPFKNLLLTRTFPTPGDQRDRSKKTRKKWWRLKRVRKRK